MFARALIVLLLVLNVGVASWWLMRPDPAAPSPPLAPLAPRLQLLGEVARPASGGTVAAPATPKTTARPAPATTTSAPSMATPAASLPAAAMAAAAGTAGVNGDERCFRFGPYADLAAATQARAALSSQIKRSWFTDTTGDKRGWRVWLPPLADHDAAQATAARIAAAGFSDYYVIPDGAQANSIALGRYGNAQAAERRQAALQAAGFPAQAAALGNAVRWLDVATAPGFDAAAARVATGAAQLQPIACTGAR